MSEDRVTDAAYYNENDPFAAAWLRNLADAGEIPAGVVDARSIQEVRPDDVRDYRECHFFAGIAGWPLALRLGGWPVGRRVWSGSCPCQPYSSAGKNKGDADERNLWPDFFRLIKECRPDTIIGEQVEAAIGHGWLDGICADLEGEGYAVGAITLGAHSSGAPHIRQRLFWVADRRMGDPGGEGLPGRPGERRDDGQELPSAQRTGGDAGGVADLYGQRCEEREESDCGSVQSGQQASRRIDPLRCRPDVFWSDFDVIPCRDGKARRVESGTFPLAPRLPGHVGLLRGYGNAICVPTAAEFVRAYLDATDHMNH